jgi:hypothetical protein
MMLERASAGPIWFEHRLFECPKCDHVENVVVASAPYRAYIIGSDGEFQNSISLECAGDAVARKKAKQLVDGHHVELWQLTRKIATFDHKPHGIFQA